MIKCIATDLDGTLLQGGATAPSPEAISLVRACMKKGVLFAVASGRPVSNIRRLFWEVADDIAFIAENGCLVTYKGQVLSQSNMDRSLAMGIINDILAVKDGEVFISYPHQYCLIPKSNRIVDAMLHTWKMTICALESADEVHEDVVKVSLCMLDGLDPDAVTRLTKKWGSRCKIAVSGPQWLDFNIGDKGTGICALREHLGLGRDEIAVFGDNYNDIPMLQNAGVGYVMDSAPDDVKIHGNRSCSRVEDSLRALLEQL